MNAEKSDEQTTMVTYDESVVDKRSAAAYILLAADPIASVKRIKDDPETDIVTAGDRVCLPDGQVASVLTVAYDTAYVLARPEDGGELQPFAFYAESLNPV